MQIKNILFPIIFILYAHQAIIQERPVRIFHGLGDSCTNHAYHVDPYKCIETGAGNDSLSLSIEKQGMEGCRLLQSEIDTLKPSFYVLGYSQGGLIARWIQLHCKEVRGMIKRMVLIGAPNLGMDELPTSDSFKPKVYTREEMSILVYKNKKWLDSLDDESFKEKMRILYAKTQPVKKETANYFYDIGIFLVNLMKPILTFLDYSPLNYLNSKSKYAPLIENLATETTKSSLNELDILVNIANRDERVVSPPESVTFGIKLFDKDGNIIPKPQTSPFLRSNYMLSSLWQDMRMINCISDTSHPQILLDEFEVIKSTIFSEDYSESTYSMSAEKMKEKFLDLYPNFCCFRRRIDDYNYPIHKKQTNNRLEMSNIRFVLEKIVI